MIKAIRNILTVTIIFLVLILLPTGFWHSQFYGISHQNFALQDIELNSKETLSISAGNFGNINITAWDKDNFLNLSGTVYSREKIEQPFSFGSIVKKHAAPYVTKNKDILYIVSRAHDKQSITIPTFFGKPININLTPWLLTPNINYADLNIKLPQNSNINSLIAEKGSITVNNFDTQVIDAQTGCGNITIDGKIKIIKSLTKSGKIFIKEKLGSIFARSEFGDIEIDAEVLKNTNYIISDSGNINLEIKSLEPGSKVIIESKSKISLNVNKNINAKIKTSSSFSTNYEPLKKDLLLTDYELGEHTVELTVGTPDSQIWLYGQSEININ